jgi:hypothetical protein
MVPELAVEDAALPRSGEPCCVDTCSAAVTPPRLLSRGGCHNRWHSLANCDHRDSTTSRTCSAAVAVAPAAAESTEPSPSLTCPAS